MDEEDEDEEEETNDEDKVEEYNNHDNTQEANQEAMNGQQFEQNIPVHISNPRQRRELEPRTAVLRGVNIINARTEASILLPVIAVTNFRSLGPKVENVRQDILERQVDLLLCSETLQKDSNQKLKL